MAGPAFNAWDLAAAAAKASHNSLLAEDIRWAQALAQGSRASSTMARYVPHWNRWCEYCRSFDLDPIPAQPVYVAAYLGKLLRWCVAEGRTFAVIKMASATIFTAHQLAGINTGITCHPMVKGVREAAGRILGLAARNSKQPLAKELCAKAAMWCERQQDFLTTAFMLVCFAGFLRYSDAVRIPAFGVKFVPAGVELFIPLRKNDQYRRGTHVRINKACSGSPICPVAILKNYLRRNPVVSDDFTIPLFRTPGSSTQWPYSEARNSVLNALVASSPGVSRADIQSVFGTHSLRKGGATAAGNRLKADDQTVAQFLAHGGWRSKQMAALYTKPASKVARAVGF